MSRNRQQEYYESGPAPGAENVFADDPEMLEMIRASRERQAKEGPARRKPWWWQAIMVLLGLLWAAAACAPALLLDVVPFHSLIPLSGLLGGMCFALGLLGHYPGRFEIVDNVGGTREKATLWKRLSLPLRLGGIACALVLPGVAYGLLLLQ